MNNNPNNYKFDPNTGEPLLPKKNQNNYKFDPNTGEPLLHNNAASVQTSNIINNNQVTSNNGYVQPIGPSIPNYNIKNDKPSPNYGISNNAENKKKKKSSKLVIFFYIFIIAIIGAAVAAILIPKKKSEPKDLTRTVMIYMVGSDLESTAGYGTAELKAIDYDDLDNKNVKVVLIAGGSNNWHNDFIDEDETSIFELTDDGFKKVKKQKVKNMGSDEVLSDYLTYVYDNYQSDRYDLIFWDHGGAIHGSEYDQLYNNDALSLEEIRAALKKSPFNSNNKIEVVAFSTCLNGTIEVADIFKDYAMYLVASEEQTMSVPGGSDFRFIENIATSDSAYDVAYKFVDGYKSKMNSFYKSAGYSQSKAYSTYSIINLENLNDLVVAVNDFFDDIDVADNYNDIVRVRANIYQYPAENIDYDMVDLYNLVDGLKELSPSKAQKVFDAFEKTVSYNWATNSKSRGLSIYFPYTSHRNYIGIFKGIYNKLSGFKEYAEFIDEFDSIRNSGKYSKNMSFDDNKTSVNYNNGKADFVLELTDEQADNFASATYLVFRDNKDGTYKPFYINGNAYLKDKKLNANIRGKQLMVTYDDEEDGPGSYPLILNELDEDNNYIRYTTGVVLEDFREDLDWKFTNAIITLIYNKKNGKIEIADVIQKPKDDEENNMPSRVSIDINDYQYIAFSASSSYTIDAENNLTSNGVITGIEVTVDNFDFELADFDDGYDYYCMFIIEDIYGNKSKTKLIKMN